MNSACKGYAGKCANKVLGFFTMVLFLTFCTGMRLIPEEDILVMSGALSFWLWIHVFPPSGRFFNKKIEKVNITTTNFKRQVYTYTKILSTCILNSGRIHFHRSFVPNFMFMKSPGPLFFFSILHQLGSLKGMKIVVTGQAGNLSV